MDDEQYSGAFLPVASFATSVNAPLASTLPRWISWMAYPTQLRTSLAPCRSQVLDDSVISTRTYCVVTGASESFSVTVPLKLSDAPVTTQYVRVLMTESSNTCDLHGASDVRNCVGYAIQEIHLGSVDASGAFTDVAKDATGKNAPEYCSSSIDPWHSAGDVNATGGYQHTGFDLFFTSGITNNLPALIPITMLYGTPDDAAAQIAYIEKRGYPISGIEMGEEPDGKHAMPEDYGALYIQWADAIHKVDAKLRLGGPIFEGVNEDIRVWPDAQGRTSWMGRFVDYLKSHGHLKDLAFVSFEHYPFEPCDVSWKSLYV